MQEKHIFNLVHLEQKEGWQLDGAAIIIQTNFFSTQQEQEGMTSPSEKITAIIQVQRLNAKDLIRGIRNKKSYQIKIGHSTPLINDLEIKELFKDKNKEEGAGVTDFISRIVQVLKGDLY